MFYRNCIKLRRHFLRVLKIKNTCHRHCFVSTYKNTSKFRITRKYCGNTRHTRHCLETLVKVFENFRNSCETAGFWLLFSQYLSFYHASARVCSTQNKFKNKSTVSICLLIERKRQKFRFQVYMI